MNPGVMADLEEVERVRLRRRLLQVDPSGVRDDLEAAAHCECGCHPSPGGRVHPDGVCLCQFTTEEQTQRLAAAERALDAVHQSNIQTWELQAALLQRLADELGVEASETVPAAPWVITGRVDGRGFYMRERWDVYSIVIAPDEHPGLDVWASVDEPGVVVREGTISDLVASDGTVDYQVALPFVVSVIRSEIRRRTCPHPTRAGDEFCPRCGAPREPAAMVGVGGWSDGVDRFIGSIDPATMRSGSRLSAIGDARVAYVDARRALEASVAVARSAGDSWSLIAVALDMGIREARDRFERGTSSE